MDSVAPWRARVQEALELPASEGRVPAVEAAVREGAGLQLDVPEVAALRKQLEAVAWNKEVRGTFALVFAWQEARRTGRPLGAAAVAAETAVAEAAVAGDAPAAMDIDAEAGAGAAAAGPPDAMQVDGPSAAAAAEAGAAGEVGADATGQATAQEAAGEAAASAPLAAAGSSEAGVQAAGAAAAVSPPQPGVSLPAEDGLVAPMQCEPAPPGPAPPPAQARPTAVPPARQGCGFAAGAAARPPITEPQPVASTSAPAPAVGRSSALARRPSDAAAVANRPPLAAARAALERAQRERLPVDPELKSTLQVGGGRQRACAHSCTHSQPGLVLQVACARWAGCCADRCPWPCSGRRAALWAVPREPGHGVGPGAHGTCACCHRTLTMAAVKLALKPPYPFPRPRCVAPGCCRGCGGVRLQAAVGEASSFGLRVESTLVAGASRGSDFVRVTADDVLRWQAEAAALPLAVANIVAKLDDVLLEHRRFENRAMVSHLVCLRAGRRGVRRYTRLLHHVNRDGIAAAQSRSGRLGPGPGTQS